MSKNYSDDLRNPKWQRKRLEILNRDNFTCTLCRDNETELHVHHEKYQGKPWDIPNEYLKTVCKECHSILHECKEWEIKKVIKQYSEKDKCIKYFAFSCECVISLIAFIGEEIQLHVVISNNTIDLLFNNIKK